MLWQVNLVDTRLTPIILTPVLIRQALKVSRPNSHHRGLKMKF